MDTSILWTGGILENLRKEDFLNEEYKGRKTPSLAERAYMAYAKKLLEGEPVDHFGNNREIDKERISAFMPKLDHLIDEHPDFLYPSFYKAKLLLLMGDEEDVLSAFIPFARQKKNDFWVWEQMAEIFHDDDELRMACYCKALSLKTQEDFLVKLRQTFSAFLVQKELYEEAKTEIDIVMDTRQKNQWGVPRQIAAWKDENWYKSAEAKLNNNNFYMKHKAIAEELLYRDIPEEVIVVEFVNKDKKMISFVKDKKKHGFFKYAGYLHKPQIGDIIKVRFDGEGQDGFYKILFARQANKDSSSEAIKDFEGVLNIRPNNNFGFIDDNFVESKFIEDNNLADGQFIRGKAILSFNRKKETWGWKVLTISNMD